MLVKLSTGKTVKEAAAALHVALRADDFNVMRVHNLKETLGKKGVPFSGEYLLFEVYHPKVAENLTDEERVESTLMRRLISIYEEGSNTYLATLGETDLEEMSEGASQEPFAQEMEDPIVKVMMETANGTSV